MSIEGVRMVHLAAQYLAAAGISFIPAKTDDSHTNLGFSIDYNRFETWPLNESGSQLSFDLRHFVLEWTKNSESRSLALEGCSHTQVLEWITATCTAFGLSRPYSYNFHYKLPYPISDGYIFRENSEVLEREIILRSLAHKVFSQFLLKHRLKSDIRTWPHHFDTGIFIQLPNNRDISIGMGLAIPDSVIDDYYFYASGYKGHESLDITDFSPLPHGNWIQEGFQGAVFRATDLNEKIVVEFLDSAFEAYSAH